MWHYWATVLAAVGAGRMAVADWHMVVVLGLTALWRTRGSRCPGPESDGLLWLSGTRWL